MRRRPLTPRADDAAPEPSHRGTEDGVDRSSPRLRAAAEIRRGEPLRFRLPYSVGDSVLIRSNTRLRSFQLMAGSGSGSMKMWR